MSKDESTVQLGVRIPKRILAALDAEAVALAERVPGCTFTRSDAVRAILTRVLDKPVVVKPKKRLIK